MSYTRQTINDYLMGVTHNDTKVKKLFAIIYKGKIPLHEAVGRATVLDEVLQVVNSHPASFILNEKIKMILREEKRTSFGRKYPSIEHHRVINSLRKEIMFTIGEQV